MDTKKFIISEEVKKIGLRGIYFVVRNMSNYEFNSDFDIYKQEVLNSILETYNTIDLVKSDKILSGFRQLHDKVKVDNDKNIASPENLYLFLIKNRTIPHINLIVDIYNTISLKYKLALGAHDCDYIDGNINLRMTTGNELYFPLGAKQPKPVKEEEYAYIDDSNEVLCYLEVRQVEKTKITLNTKNCFYIIQGNENTEKEYLVDCMNELLEKTIKYCGGHFEIIGVVY